MLVELFEQHPMVFITLQNSCHPPHVRIGRLVLRCGSCQGLNFELLSHLLFLCFIQIFSHTSNSVQFNFIHIALVYRTSHCSNHGSPPEIDIYFTDNVSQYFVIMSQHYPSAPGGNEANRL